jgi:pimeloyl-ACP methyl ester carboxylesterase
MRRGKRAGLLRIPKRRADDLLLRCVRTSFRFLSAVPHSLFLSALWAERLFLTPPPHRRTRREQKVLSQGVFRHVDSGGCRLATWRWGEGPPVLLVHGWGGHAGRLNRFVAPLVEAGFSVVAFDAPGHGASRARSCSVQDFIRAVSAVADDCGPLAGFIGHSLGAAAGILALRNGVRTAAAVLLAPPANPEELAGKFANICRMPGPVRDSMKVRIAARNGVAWENLRLFEPAPRAPAPLLIFHDHGDHKVPARNARLLAAAWPGSSLIMTRGLGHHKILRSPEVVSGAVRFLLGTRPADRPVPAPAARIA